MLTNEIYFEIFLPWMIILVGKVTISASSQKIHFLKISEQAPLKQTRKITKQKYGRSDEGRGEICLQVLFVT